jgi:DNA helicase-2/ATP-dependent DNA helicase PcrA
VNNPNYLQELNENQRAAVECTEGPVMIIAGAGSGKTRVLTYRIAHLLNKGVDAFNILSLTFTNKAAREMRNRIETIIGSSEARNLWMGTFHSVFAKILRFEADKLGYPNNFTIYDTDDSKSLIKSILKENNLDEKVYKPGMVLSRISAAKSSLISPQAYMNDSEAISHDRSSGRPLLGEIYLKYNTRCFKSGAMDFDDLLFNTNVLLRDFPDVLYKYQNKFKYILVDEYQDTNFSQYVIVRKLASLFENICVVGDDAQSIYAFRGANIQNILNFEKDYPDLHTFKLEQNYRSSKVIVNAANSIISNNKEQLDKTVWTHNEEGAKIKVMRALTDNEEGALVANSIFTTKMNQQRRDKEFAILYRTNAQSRAMEEALRKLNIPYRIYGGLSFYKRKEIKDLLAYFRLAINPNDEEALKRVINYPMRGIGQTTVEKVIIAANQEGKRIWEILENPLLLHNIIGGGTASKIDSFVTMIRSYNLELKTKSAYELAERIAMTSGILRDLSEDKTPEGVSRTENIQELMNGIREFSETEAPDENGEAITRLRTLDEFTQDIALLTDADEKDKDNLDTVSLMTIHSAKGLEFPFVYVVGLEENLFPSQLSLNSRSDLEEERRLFYVALTRAEKQAFLTYSTSRYRWGNLTSCEPSRFLEEIDSQYLEFEGFDRKAPKPANDHQYNDLDWENFRRPSSSSNGNGNGYNQYKAKPPAPKPAYTPPVVPKNLVNVKKASSAAFTADDAEAIMKLQSGMQVEHEKFGIGKVLSVEGMLPNKKATVFFEGVGQKQLLLKFAKLKIVN